MEVLASEPEVVELAPEVVEPALGAVELRVQEVVGEGQHDPAEEVGVDAGEAELGVVVAAVDRGTFVAVVTSTNHLLPAPQQLAVGGWASLKGVRVASSAVEACSGEVEGGSGVLGGLLGAPAVQLVGDPCTDTDRTHRHHPPPCAYLVEALVEEVAHLEEHQSMLFSEAVAGEEGVQLEVQQVVEVEGPQGSLATEWARHQLLCCHLCSAPARVLSEHPCALRRVLCQCHSHLRSRSRPLGQAFPAHPPGMEGRQVEVVEEVGRLLLETKSGSPSVSVALLSYRENPGTSHLKRGKSYVASWARQQSAVLAHPSSHLQILILG